MAGKEDINTYLLLVAVNGAPGTLKPPIVSWSPSSDQIGSFHKSPFPVLPPLFKWEHRADRRHHFGEDCCVFEEIAASCFDRIFLGAELDDC